MRAPRVKKHVICLPSLASRTPANSSIATHTSCLAACASALLIAIALSGNHQILIADEPTTALDVTIQAQILELLQDVQQRTGMSIIFITHNLGVVAEIAQRAIVLYAGEIAESLFVQSLFGNARMPYTAALLRSLPRLSGNKDRRLTANPRCAAES